MKKTCITVVLVAAVISVLPCYAENIRGNVVRNVMLSDSSVEKTDFGFRLEDIFAVSAGDDTDRIAGTIVEITLPDGMSGYRGSIALNIYSRVTPGISSGTGTYFGRLYHSALFEDSSKLTFFIPAETSSSPPANSGSGMNILPVLRNQDMPVLFTVLPMMKGFPSDMYEMSFRASVKPVLKPFGTLKIQLSDPDGAAVSATGLLIDGKSYPAGKDKLQLEEGRYNLRIITEDGTEITRAIEITNGAETAVIETITPRKSSAYFDFPEGTAVYLDGERISPLQGQGIELAAGEHLVLFKLGEHKISKKFTISSGKDCKISLFLDIFIEEN